MWVASSVACSSEEPTRDPPKDVVAELVADANREQSEIAAGAGIESARSLAIAVPAVPQRLDPTGAPTPWARRVIDDLVFEGLTRRVADAYPFAEPALADRCEVSPAADPRAVYCHVPRERTFHDGKPVTVADVLYSFTYWIDPRRGGLRLRHGLTALQSATPVDGPPSGQGADPGRWIEIQFSRGEPLALERIADIKIVPEAAHKGRTRAFSLAPIGTGPMKVAGQESDRLVLEAVGDDDDETAPRRITLLAVSDGAEGLTLLRRGEVQILAEVSPVHLPFELTKPGMAPRFEAFHLTPPRYELLVYNMRRSPQAQSRLRGALDDALPRGLIDEAYRSVSRSTRAPVDVDDPSPIDLAELEKAGPSAQWGTAGLPALPTYDEQGPVRAGQLLDELGWPLERSLRRRGNNNLRLVLTWDGARGRSRTMANAVRDGLRDVGVHIPYATASWAYIFGLLRRGDFDLGLVRLATSSDADLYDLFHSQGAANLSGVADEQLDRALLSFRAAKTRDDRVEALGLVKQRVEELLPVSVLHASSQVMLVSRRLDGLTFVDDLPRLDTLRLGPEPDWIAGR